MQVTYSSTCDAVGYRLSCFTGSGNRQGGEPSNHDAESKIRVARLAGSLFLAAITALVNRRFNYPDKYNGGHVLNSTAEIKWMTA
jgi:hypothetical protein